jgi:hypothetical protein
MVTWGVVTAVLALVTAGGSAAVLLARRRRSRPLTRRQRLRQGRAAMRDLRAANPRLRRRPDVGRTDSANRSSRHAGPIAENVTYSDAAGWGDGGGGGGGGGGGD